MVAGLWTNNFEENDTFLRSEQDWCIEIQRGIFYMKLIINNNIPE